MMRQRRAKRHREATAELNITAFMNLMVVLVPFLLITAVFSQVSILDLNLPGTAQAQAPEEPPKALQVVVRVDRLELIERSSNSFTSIANLPEGGHNFKKLNEALQFVKATPDFENITAITLLLEEDIDYDTLVQTMDAVRLVEQQQEEGSNTTVFGALFPDISIGSAPRLAKPGKASAQPKSGGGQP